MNDPIQITIKKGQTAEGTVPQQEETLQKNQEQGKPSLGQQAINTALIETGKQIIIEGTQQVASLTGNYHFNDQFNQTLSFGADVLMLAKGGPIGAIAVGTKYTMQIGKSVAQQVEVNRKHELLMKRSGRISVNGSRYLYGD